MPGQPQAAFFESLRAGRGSHAVLLEGGDAEQRRQTAAEICAAWLCEGSEPPCGECRHCRKALAAKHPDVTILSDEEGKQIPVDSVRALLEQAIVKPSEAQRRVFVVENAHRLTVQGQNALLKCIEEPPSAVCFLLLCPSKKELLPTIISRVTAFALPGAAEEYSAEALEIAKKIAEALAENDEWAVMAASAPLDKNKALMLESLAAVKEILRTGLLFAGETPELAQGGAEPEIGKRLQALGTGRLVCLLESVQSLERDLERNANLALSCARIPATMF
ncbi:MAG: hypothetical protein LBQ80_03070 [Clostridium sp.]|jgi:DNA polymerase-3 subunit delta'|nr:hypothetical protein [Clostridium sp.]